VTITAVAARKSRRLRIVWSSSSISAADQPDSERPAGPAS
jgi:hypothetical protein